MRVMGVLPSPLSIKPYPIQHGQDARGTRNTLKPEFQNPFRGGKCDRGGKATLYYDSCECHLMVVFSFGTAHESELNSARSENLPQAARRIGSALFDYR